MNVDWSDGPRFEGKRRTTRGARRRGFAAGVILGIAAGAALGACMEVSTPSNAQDASLDAGSPGHGGDAGHATDASAETGVDPGAPYGCTVPITNATDLQFIDMMVPHHQMATMMADEVLARGSRADVKAFAQKAKDDQTAEIAQMKAARKELTGTDVLPPPPPDPHMDAEMAMMMHMSGEELDQMFLEDMIAHHAGAISVSHRAKDSLRRSDIQELSRKIFDAQAMEIGQLQAMLHL